MAKQGRHRKGGRVTPKGTRPLSFRSSERQSWFERREPEPDLLLGVRRALAEDHPLGLLEFVSSLLTIVDRRGRSPLDPPGGDPDDLSREELVESFLDVDRPETTALLGVIGAMSDDKLERVRIRRELEGRRATLPKWIDTLGEADTSQAYEMVHVLGDGDNIVLAVRFPDGEALSVVVYIDHNLGTVVKDALVMPKPIDELVEYIREEADPDTVYHPLDLADARVRISEAIERGAMTFPPYETDTWPQCRPLVEWITRQLPEGGVGYVRPVWDDKELQALTERFFASPFAAGLDDADRRGLLESLLWFGTDYGPGDPMRWSPTAVEILLADWIPRKIVADVGYLAKAPKLLRAWIRFCHDERGIRASLTASTLDAVDEWEPDYHQAIRSPRPPGPAALLAAMSALDPDGPWPTPFVDIDYREMMLDSLLDAVGGDKALDALNDAPLPDEPFVWAGVAADVGERVGEVLALCDRCCDTVLDVEYRTACRRFLHIVASGDPNIFRRQARSDSAAAAVCWTIGKANDLFSPMGGGMRVKDLLAHFGIRKGSVSQRASTMLMAGGFAQETYGEVRLGTPDLLISSRRRSIIALRDHYLTIDAE